MISSLNSSFTTTDEASTSKQSPPSIISPKLLESYQTAVFTTEVSGTTPLTPEELKEQRLLFIQQFREKITKTTQHTLTHSQGTEFISKLLSESELEVTLTSKPSGPPPIAPSSMNRLSYRSSDRRSPKVDQRVRSLERMSETTSTSNNYLKPPRSNGSSTKRFSGRFSSTPYPAAKKTGNLLKDSFLSEAKQSHNDYQNNTYAVADSYAMSEFTADMMNEDYDSDYWEDERLLLKWQARRAGLIYFGFEELEKHKQQTTLTSEEKMKLLMR